MKDKSQLGKTRWRSSAKQNLYCQNILMYIEKKLSAKKKSIPLSKN